MTTQRQIEANRKNSQKSCGPKSPAGKDRSKMNSLQLGLFARSTLLPGEDSKALARLHRELVAQYQPQGPAEKQLADEIAAVKWRLLRCSKVESGLFHMYKFIDGKSGNEAFAFANDLKNLSAITKLPMVEGHLERKLDRLLKRLSTLQANRA